MVFWTLLAINPSKLGQNQTNRGVLKNTVQYSTVQYSTASQAAFAASSFSSWFKIAQEMTEKNEDEDGNSISLKSSWHMKWDRQQILLFLTSCLMG